MAADKNTTSLGPKETLSMHVKTIKMNRIANGKRKKEKSQWNVDIG